MYHLQVSSDPASVRHSSSSYPGSKVLFDLSRTSKLTKTTGVCRNIHQSHRAHRVYTQLVLSTNISFAERHIKCGEEKPTCYKCLDARRKCRYQDLTVPYRPHAISKATSIISSTASYLDTSSVSQFSVSQESKVSQSTDISNTSFSTNASKVTQTTALTSASFRSSDAEAISSPCPSLSQGSSSVSPQPPPSNINSSRKLDFYLRVIAPGLDSRKSELWITMLPQVALQSSAVQNALMAMAGYYECGMWSKHNLKMYNLAIQHLVQGDLLQVPAITRLFCCVLFVAIEVSVICDHSKFCL